MTSYIPTEREKIVIEMWEANATQRQIASALMVTLGVVSGIATRLKAKGVIKHKTREQLEDAFQRGMRAAGRPVPAVPAPEPAPEPEAPETAPEPDPTPAAEAFVIEPVPAAPIDDRNRIGIDIMGLNAETCRWVLPRRNADGMAMFCGDEVYHRSFCACHAARAFQIPNDWKKASRAFRKMQALLTITR